MQFFDNEARIRTGVIGCGFIGKRHIDHIVNNPECELTAICDIRSKSELGIEDIGIPLYTTIDEMYQSHPELDLVVIATPNGLHARHSIEAIERGSHVIIEKPMGLSKKECESIISSSLLRSRLVFCVMQNRFSPPSVWLKDVVGSGKLGRVFFVIINCIWNRDERYYKTGGWKGTKALDGGCLYTQFSHFIDIMYWLFGDIYEPAAMLQNFSHTSNTEFADSGVVNFKFREGGMGCINFTTSVWDKNFESSITIIAENGTIKVGGQYMNTVEYCHIKDYNMPDLAECNPPNDYGHYKGSAANHGLVLQNSIDTLKGRTQISTNAIEGLKVVEIIEQIYSVGGGK